MATTTRRPRAERASHVLAKNKVIECLEIAVTNWNKTIVTRAPRTTQGESHPLPTSASHEPVLVGQDLLLILKDLVLVLLKGRLIGEDAGHVGGEPVELRLIGQDGLLIGDDIVTTRWRNGSEEKTEDGFAVPPFRVKNSARIMKKHGLQPGWERMTVRSSVRISPLLPRFSSVGVQ